MSVFSLSKLVGISHLHLIPWMTLLQSQTFQEICVPRTFTNMALVEALLTEHEQASALDGETNDDGDAHCIPSGPVLPTVSVEETMVVEVVTPKGDDIFGNRQSAFEQLKELWMNEKVWLLPCSN